MNIYKVRDSVAERWFPAFEAENNKTAERLFVAACNDENSPIGKSPSDYELWLIGHFNDTNGKLTQGDDHRLVITTGAAVRARISNAITNIQRTINGADFDRKEQKR